MATFAANSVSYSLQTALNSPLEKQFAEGIGALMLSHYLQNQGIIPEIIVPTPSLKLADPLAKILQLPPPIKALKKDLFESNSYTLTREAKHLEDKKILLIGGKIDADFFKAGETLAGSFPHSIYGLAFSLIL